MSRTYLVTVRITGPDDRVTLCAAAELAEHIANHYRHDTLTIEAMAPTRERLDDPFPTEPDPALVNILRDR